MCDPEPLSKVRTPHPASNPLPDIPETQSPPVFLLKVPPDRDMSRVPQLGIVADQGERLGARQSQEVSIGHEASNLELRQAALARSKELTGTAELKVQTAASRRST